MNAKIQQALKKKRWQKIDLEIITGLSHDVINRALSGGKNSRTEMSVIASALNEPVNELFTNWSKS